MSANGKTDILTPKQALFLKNYTDPKSKTFGNAKQSAISAGYSEEYADTFLNQNQEWLSENLRYSRMVEKAEKNLEEFMDMDTKTTVITKSGDLVDVEDTQLKKIKQDTSKFVAERLRKGRWAPRTELTGEEGKDLVVKVVKFNDDGNNTPTQVQSEEVSTATLGSD